MQTQEKESRVKQAIQAWKIKWRQPKKQINKKAVGLYQWVKRCLVIPIKLADQLCQCLDRWLDPRLDRWLTFFIVILFIIFVAVMFSDAMLEWMSRLLGTKNDKNKTLTFIGLGVGGLVLWRRTRSAEKQAEAMKDATNNQAEAAKLTEIGHTQERLKTSIEHLGNEKASARIGAAYELYHLAKDNKSYRETVCEILCGHIRQKTQEENYKEDQKDGPSEEIKTFLKLLCREEKGPFRGCQIDLTSSFLQRADLQEAQLQGADLSGAQLRGTKLLRAQLQGANLSEAQLQGANLSGAQLWGANLRDAQLWGADFSWAHLEKEGLLEDELWKMDLSEDNMQEMDLPKTQLRGANLSRAQLWGANLSRAQLREANLSGAQLQGANLSRVQLQGVDLSETQLQGANLSGAQLQGMELWGIQLQGANLSKAQLKRADLSSACMQGANLSGAWLQGADLSKAQLQGANLSGAQLQGAYLWKAQLQGANLSDAQLQGANLSEPWLKFGTLLETQSQEEDFLGAQLQGANLSDAQLQGANLKHAQLQGISSSKPSKDNFQDRVRARIGKESDFSNVVFSGGLDAEQVNTIISSMPDWMDDKGKEEMKSRLNEHVDKEAGNELLSSSGAAIGAYAEGDAEKWIAEYEKSMKLSVPKNEQKNTEGQ